MKEQLHTIQLTRRELGLIHHIMSIKYTDIDDNVKFGIVRNRHVGGTRRNLGEWRSYCQRIHQSIHDRLHTIHKARNLRFEGRWELEFLNK